MAENVACSINACCCVSQKGYVPDFSSILTFSVNSDGLNMPRLIINQLKWLDRVVDSKVSWGLFLSLGFIESMFSTLNNQTFGIYMVFFPF